MKKIIHPSLSTSYELLKRPMFESDKINSIVIDILENVKSNGDKELIDLTEKFQSIRLINLMVTEQEIKEAIQMISLELKQAIEQAYHNIYKFHKIQQREEEKVETTSGVICWRKSVPIEKVGLYIPGGTAPLFSTILMLGIPAKIADCKNIILCTPCDNLGNINPAILYTANLLGINTIYKIGGAQAIGAMAYGTETIPKVDKIFGPGNQYVTKAKELVQKQGTAIDMPAGPSELLIIADNTADIEFVAADLLSQAEHGADSQVILLTDDKKLFSEIDSVINSQIKDLPRKEIAITALNNSKCILLNSINECIEWSNLYAPEHLILNITNAESYLNNITNAGSVFIGNYSCESAGDYASGTNHTLPTNGHAKAYSGVSLDSFVKKITFQKLSATGIKNIGPAIELMAEAEDLVAHKNAVTIRLNKLKKLSNEYRTLN